MSVDIYRGFGNDSLPGGAEVANVSAFFAREVFPRMHSAQVSMVVPGFFGCISCMSPGGSGCGTLAAQEARLRAKLRSYIGYLRSEPRMIGLAPWHMDNRKNVECDVARKPKCMGCDMRLGAQSFPGLLADWQAFGASILRQQRRERASER